MCVENNKTRKIKVAVEAIVEVPTDMSDIEVEKMLSEKYGETPFMWCDENEDLFEFEVEIERPTKLELEEQGYLFEEGYSVDDFKNRKWNT